MPRLGSGPMALGARSVRRVVRVVVVVALALLLAVGVMWVFQRRLIYLPSQIVPDVASVLPGAEEVTFSTEDGLTLAAWLVPAAGDASGGTVVVFNGNAGNRADRTHLLEWRTRIHADLRHRRDRVTRSVLPRRGVHCPNSGQQLENGFSQRSASVDSV